MVTLLAWTAERPGFESWFGHLSRVSMLYKKTQLFFKVTKHGTISHVRYGFILVCYSNLEIFDFENAMTLKTGLGVREGH